MKKKFVFLFITSILLTILTNEAFPQKSIFSDVEEYDKTETAKKAKRKLAERDIDGAIETLDKAIERKKDLFEAYRTRAFIRRYYKNDLEGAISDLNEAIKIKPDDYDLYLSRASLKRWKSDFVGALQDYDTILKYLPDSIPIYILKANTRKLQKDFDGAMADIQTALKIQPENINLHLSLTNLLNDKNEPDKAFAHLQNFLAEYVKNRNGKLPKIKGEIVKKKIPDELNKNDGALDGIPVKRYSRMSFNVNSLEDFRNQQSKIEEARSLSKAFFQFSKLLLSKNMLDEALKNLDTAIEIDKNIEQAYGLRGAIYLSRGETEKAISAFDDAINIADDPVFYLNRGTAYLLNGNEKESQKDFDKFIQLYPEGNSILAQRIADTKKTLLNKSEKPQN